VRDICRTPSIAERRVVVAVEAVSEAKSDARLRPVEGPVKLQNAPKSRGDASSKDRATEEENMECRDCNNTQVKAAAARELKVEMCGGCSAVCLRTSPGGCCANESGRSSRPTHVTRRAP
jgi:hypothetical protein